MKSRTIVAVVGICVALAAVAKADSPFKQKYKDEIMRLNAETKNLAIELEGLFRVEANKYRPKVHQLLEAKHDLTERIRDYDKLCEHFTPNVERVGEACHAITSKSAEVEKLYREITQNADDFGQFMKDVAGDRSQFESAMRKLDTTAADLCKNSDLVTKDRP